VAIITPDKEHLLKYAEDNKIEGTFEELCKNIQIRKLILSDVTGLGKADGLYGFEQAKNVYLESEGFASRNIMTNTMKLIRFEARVYYKEIIDGLYKEGELALK
jgi:long-chain acyl-CoA synthetase